MQQKTTSMLHLLIGAAGSLILFGACKSTDGNTVTRHFIYQNKSDFGIEIKVYNREFIYDITLSKGSYFVQTEKLGAMNRVQDESILWSDSIHVVFSELNKEIWCRGPIGLTTDKIASSPYLFENYIWEDLPGRESNYSYFFTQQHIDMATEIP